MKIEEKIAELFGERCSVKDTNEFPDLKFVSRCPCCLAWDFYDNGMVDEIVNSVVTDIVKEIRDIWYSRDLTPADFDSIIARVNTETNR